MAVNPLATAIRRAARTGDDYARLFARVGNNNHPRGFVMVAYRNALRALRGSDLSPSSIREIMGGLQRTIMAEGAAIMRQAEQAGIDNASAQLDAYGLPLTPVNPTGALAQVAALSAAVAQQTTFALAASASGQEDLIIGDDNRQGIVRPGPIVADLTGFIVALSEAMLSRAAAPYQDRFKKQAVAAIDERTTDCCLKVHGQIVDLDKKFHLTGTPRYADYMDWSPFHRYCRTSIALYLDEYDLGVTDALRRAAVAEMALRAQGRTSPGRYASARGGDNG